MKAQGSFPSHLTVFLISFSVLAYEINFIRVFAYAQWHNLAPLIITLALLGFGASGTCLAVVEKKAPSLLEPFHHGAILLFPVLLGTGFLASASLRFNPYEMGLDPAQTLGMALNFTLTGLGFLMGAAAICASLMHFKVSRIYFTNLVGSAAGAAFVLWISFFLHPWDTMAIILAIALVPAALLLTRNAFRTRAAAGAAIFLTLCCLVFASLGLDPRQVSQYKPLSSALSLPDAAVIHEAFSPLGVVQVVQAKGLRITAGLSLVSPFEVPEQKVIFLNGEGPSPIIPYQGEAREVGYLKQTTAFLPFFLAQARRGALIVGAGGGESILRARLAGFGTIDALEPNPNVVRLMTEDFAAFSGDLFRLDGVRILCQEARSFIKQTPNRYDLIELALVDSFNASASGVLGLSESYLYTLESVKALFSRLNPEGMIAFTRWVVTPARDNLKLFNLVITALRQSGIQNVQDHLLAIRSLQTLTLLVLRRGASDPMIQGLKSFAGQRGFDLVFYPGMPEKEANQRIRLDSPVYHRAMTCLLGQNAGAFEAAYDFDIQVPTDNRPYFHNFFRPRVVKLIRAYGPAQVPVTEWGYLVLILLLVPVLLVSALLTLFPLLALRPGPEERKGAVFFYFALTGTGFFFIELPMIQKMGLFLGHPLYAISVILTTLLLFSSLGSFLSGRGFHRRGRVGAAAVLVGAIIWVYALVLDDLLAAWLGLGFGARLGLTALVMAPLGIAMGIPFPAGLALVREKDRALAAWAFGINGFFSVISILCAALLAVIYGFGAVMAAAGLFYLGAGLAALGLAAPKGGLP